MNYLSPEIVSSSALEWAHPVVREWFLTRLGVPTEPQERGWPHILAGKTTLISAPTGSGKTLAAFLACIDRLVRKALTGELFDQTQVLYVSPLKALGNDISQPGSSGCLGRTKPQIAPTSVAPITFFIRDDADWLVAHQREIDVDRLLSSNSSEVLGFLKRRGASFLADVIRGTGKTKDDVEVALWELVATGLITADGFDNLRALIDPKPRANQRHGRDGRPRWRAIPPRA